MSDHRPVLLENPTLLVTCPRGWEAEARQELRRILPGAAVRSLFIGGNIIVRLDGPAEDAVEAIARAETYTIARVTPVRLRLQIGPERASLQAMEEAAKLLGPAHPERSFMVLVDRRGDHDFTSPETALAVADAFVSGGRPPVDLEAPEQLCSVEIFQDLCFMGLNRTEHLLRKQLQRMRRWGPGERPISRAEMKLREALDRFGIELSADARALDLGAAPGEWTRVLAERVGEVIAVDPGALDERVLELPNVVHMRCRADELDPEQIGTFDLLTNDMNMNPRDSSELMCALAPLLRPGAAAIMTIKFSTRRRAEHVEQARELLGDCYEAIEIHRMPHNALETTALMRRK